MKKTKKMKKITNDNKDCLLCQGKTITMPGTLAEELCTDHLIQITEVMLRDLIVGPMRARAEQRKESGWF